MTLYSLHHNQVHHMSDHCQTTLAQLGGKHSPTLILSQLPQAMHATQLVPVNLVELLELCYYYVDVRIVEQVCRVGIIG